MKRFLLGIVIASIVVIFAVSQLYRWKGLEMLPKKSEYEKSYYISF